MNDELDLLAHIDHKVLAAWNAANKRARDAYRADPFAGARVGESFRCSGYESLLANGRTPKQARDWGRANGYDIAANGRVPTYVIEEYLDAIREASA